MICKGVNEATGPQVKAIGDEGAIHQEEADVEKEEEEANSGEPFGLRIH